MAGPTPPLREVARRAPELAPPARIIVLSDLHLGSGTRPGEGPDPLEHFFQDEAFAGMLARLARRAAVHAERYALVLNGDVFDFVRTVRLPASADEVRAWEELLRGARVQAPPGVLESAAAGRFSALERRYGPDASEHESVWKLRVMADGHPLVFRSLAEWCRAGHELVVVRGNHDVEWAWPGVRRAFRMLLEGAAAGPLPRGTLHFRMHRYRRGNVQVEHGHAIRWTTFAEGRFGGVRTRSLKQPFGSYINRFVLNPVERLALRSPGVSSSSHLKRQLRREPLRLWRGLLRHAFRAVPPLGRATWRMWHRRTRGWWPTHLGNALGLGLLAAPLLPAELLASLGLDSTPTRTGAALLALATPHLGLAFLETLDIVRDDTRRRALAHARQLGARPSADAAGERVVVLGHTHRAEVSSWRTGAQRVVYANPGCWLGEDEAETGCPRFVWCAWDGHAYRRTRILECEGSEGRCRTHSKS